MPEPKLERRQVLDPAVADLLSGMERRKAETQLPRQQREKKARERAKITSRREQRATYDLPPQLRQRIKDLADRERLPASQLVSLAIIRFLNDLESGTVDVDAFKQPSRSPRYDWNLDFPESLMPGLVIPRMIIKNGKKRS
jgi:predicted DNA-binding protein